MNKNISKKAKKISLYLIIVFFLIFIVFYILIKKNQNTNICYILKKNPKWINYSIKSQHRWNTPAFLQLAFIYQESRFNAEAKPPLKRIAGIPIPFKYKSTAYGYSQALNETWDNYKKFVNNKNAKRNNFENSTDFIAWYLYRARKYLKLNNNQVEDLYLAYHEGINGYRNKTFEKRKNIKLAAKKVESLALKYKHEIKTCN